MLAHERRLLLGCEHETALGVVGMNRRKDPAVGAEVWMTHVRRLDGAVHTEGDPAELTWGHDIGTRWSVVGGRWSVLAGRCGRVVGSRMPVLPSAVCRLPSAVCRRWYDVLMSALLSDDRGIIVA